MLKSSSLCLYSSNLGTFWLKIEQFWPFEEISIFSNGGHLGYRTALTDTHLKGDHPRITSAKFGWDHKVLTHGQERLFHKVTSVSILSFVEWLDTFSYVLRPADVRVKEVNHIRCFAIDIAKDLILLSCCLAMELLCVLQLETTTCKACHHMVYTGRPSMKV